MYTFCPIYTCSISQWPEIFAVSLTHNFSIHIVDSKIQSKLSAKMLFLFYWTEEKRQSSPGKQLLNERVATFRHPYNLQNETLKYVFNVLKGSIIKQILKIR